LHVPLSKEAVRECMPVFFELLASEPHPAVRAVLGHFFFVYIHPYMDGNGHLARFIFNAMLVTGGYAWTIVPLEQRKPYMSALERASVLTSAPRFEHLVISATGRMALMRTIDPAVFVGFKRWMATEVPSRPEPKRRRDARQADIVQALLDEGLLQSQAPGRA